MLKTKVILSQVTNLSDARYGAGMGVDYIGFSLDPNNAYYVTPAEANTIRDWLSGVSIIGELSTVDSSSGYKIDYIQVSNEKQVYDFDEPILKLDLTIANKKELSNILERTSELVSFFILTVDEEVLNSLSDEIKKLCETYKCFIATPLSADNIQFVLSLNPYGLVLYGTKEIKPGLSDYDGLADVLELLEAE
jgi:phosphoribosylanthranilate isomerase